MRIDRLVRPAGLASLLLLAAACSENNELDPGTFAGRLSGARSETLAGSAAAGIVFTEVGVSYSVTLVTQGQEDVFLSVSCPTEETPPTGTYPIGGSAENCSASYVRTVDDPVTPIEQADAVSGNLVLSGFEGEFVSGSVEFTGPLVVGETETGQVTASAQFVARRI